MLEARVVNPAFPARNRLDRDAEVICNVSLAFSGALQRSVFLGLRKGGDNPTQPKSLKWYNQGCG